MCLWVCYHDNSKLCSSILTKLVLYVKVVTISSSLNFGRPVPPGRGSGGANFLPTLTTASADCLRLREAAAGLNFCLRLTTASAQCLRLSEHFFHCLFVCWQAL